MEKRKTFATLTNAQRELLIDHIDKIIPVGVRDGNRYNTLRSLMSAGLIRDARNGLHFRPQETMLTEQGRDVAAQILANYADCLVRAGFGEIVGAGDVQQMIRKGLSVRVTLPNEARKIAEAKNLIKPG